MQVTLDIPREIFDRLPGEESARDRELVTDLACGLYAAWRINSHLAARWLGVSRQTFWDELGKRRIPRQITAEMISEDAALDDRQ